MVDNQIRIKIANNKVTCTTKTPLNLEEFFQVVFTALLSSMQSVVKAQKPEDQEQCTEELYDLFNVGASNLLTFFAPELEMRPHLTTQAILQAENQIIEAEYAKQKQERKQKPLISEQKPPIMN